MEPLSDLVAALMEAIVILSGDGGLPAGTVLPPPEIASVPHSQIEAMACGRPCAVRAIFVPRLGIFVDDDLDVRGDPFARSILLHELVHYRQELLARLDGLPPCEAYRRAEWEAYAVQDAWLESVHSSRRVPTQFVTARGCR